MNYAYLFVDTLQNHGYDDAFAQLKKSVEVLKKMVPDYESIHIFNNEKDGKVYEFCQEQGCYHRYIELSRNYYGSNSVHPINILVEKIVQLRNFDPDKEVVLLDIDTLFTNPVPKNIWTPANSTMWNAEFYLVQWRNLGNVLPKLPWTDLGIDFNQWYPMYNSGVVYIPRARRFELCEKALKIVDLLNNGSLPPEDRLGNKLDEQIALSIVLHHAYGQYGALFYSDTFIHHYWKEKQEGIRWWE
jgi:hypothetical protein